MKKGLSILLAVFMLTGLSAPASAAAPEGARFWNAKAKRFELHDPPVLTRITEETDEAGTRAQLYLEMSDEMMEFSEFFYKNDEDYNRTIADALGVKEGDAEGSFHVNVQVAYSFDGKTWVNDWSPDSDPDDPYYGPETDFDLDEDGYNEYRDMPTVNVDKTARFLCMDVFRADGSYMNARYCDNEDADLTIKQALTRRNDAILQGRGEYLGSYDRDAEDSFAGFAVDFNKNTLYVKARYRVYTSFYEREDGDLDYRGAVTQYSDWSEVKTFNNANRSYEGQDCEPDVSALLTEAPLVLTTLAADRYTYERDGEELKGTAYRFSVRYPDKTDAAIARFLAMEMEDREERTGEHYDPKIVVEMKVGDGEWYYYTDMPAGDQFFDFRDEYYVTRDKMEAQGYKPGDPICLRARLWGDWSYSTENADEYKELVVPSEDVFIQSGLSNVAELNLTGKYNVNYELDGGSFASGAEQLTQFDDETDKTVDLTAADYTPEKRHFVFKGWFADAAFKTPVTSFDTARKMSRTYYAKWEELPFYALTYDLGAVTAYVHNPNEERIYPDSGEDANGVLPLADVSYEGTAFLGWFDKAEGGSKIETLTFADMTADMTLYAHWELPTYTITYDRAGTDYENNPMNPAAFRIDPKGEEQVLLYAPERTGYIFDGWYYDKNVKTEALSHDEAAGTWLLDRAENVTVYAKWIRGRWKINYVLDPADAWNGANPETYTFGDAVTFEAPSRTGYEFGGWFADKAFTEEMQAITTVTTGDVTVYAKLTAIPYTITYDLRDDTASEFLTNPNPAERTVDDEVVLQPLVPVNRLYAFLGWYNNVNFDGEPVRKITAGTDKDVTVYAKLFKNQWGDVNFDGAVSAEDARLVLRAAVHLEKLRDEACAWGDLSDHSAKHELTSADARLALRLAVKLETVSSMGLPEFPID